TAQPALPRKPFIVPHHQLRLELLHGIHGYADDDHERGAANIEVHGATFQEPHGEVAVKPGADAPPEVVEVNPGDHPLRQQAHGRQVDPANARQPLQKPSDATGRTTASPYSGYV